MEQMPSIALVFRRLRRACLTARVPVLPLRAVRVFTIRPASIISSRRSPSVDELGERGGESVILGRRGPDSCGTPMQAHRPTAHRHTQTHWLGTPGCLQRRPGGIRMCPHHSSPLCASQPAALLLLPAYLGLGLHLTGVDLSRRACGLMRPRSRRSEARAAASLSPRPQQAQAHLQAQQSTTHATPRCSRKVAVPESVCPLRAVNPPLACVDMCCCLSADGLRTRLNSARRQGRDVKGVAGLGHRDDEVLFGSDAATNTQCRWCVVMRRGVEKPLRQDARRLCRARNCLVRGPTPHARSDNPLVTP